MTPERKDPLPIGAALARLRAGAEGVRVRGRLAHRDEAVLLVDVDGEVAIEAPERGAPGDIVEGVLFRHGECLALSPVDIVVKRAGEPSGSDASLPGRLPLLKRRDAFLREMRAHFHERDFVEVQTPARVACPGLEPHLVPLESGPGRWLRTSPELHLKRLLAAGLERIFEIGPVFRGDERGSANLTEFAMIEWYRAWESLDALVEDLERLLPRVARVVGTDPSRVSGCDLTRPFERLSLSEAFTRHTGLDPFDPRLETGELRAEAERLGAPASPGETRAEVTARLFVHAVEDRLGRERPTVLDGYPADDAAMSRVESRSGREVALRFELYAGGFELANAFDELIDPAEQRARFDRWLDERARFGSATPLADERFLAALEAGHPPASGIALGVDRLFALCVGESDLRRTLPFPDEV